PLKSFCLRVSGAIHLRRRAGRQGLLGLFHSGCPARASMPIGRGTVKRLAPLVLRHAPLAVPQTAIADRPATNPNRSAFARPPRRQRASALSPARRRPRFAGSGFARPLRPRKLAPASWALRADE